MSANAWIFQRNEQIRDMGEDQAPWYVGWYEPDGRRKKESCGPGFRGKEKAERLKRKLEAELMTGTYQMKAKTLWPDFRKEYEQRVLSGSALATREQTSSALDHFERLVKPVRVFAISTAHLDDYISARRLERGKKVGSLVSPATINKELRHLKAVLRVAVEWGYLSRAPRFRMQREPGKLPRYVPPDHFAAMYAACDSAKHPEGLPYPPGDWWRGLLMTGYMTGWRIGDLLGLTRDDLDLEGGYAITRWEESKGKRDDRVKLHPVVVEHLRQLPGFTPTVFPFPKSRYVLQEEFGRLQRAAGIHLPCREKHEHTDACHVYGFHDLRRAFATMNAARLSADALQALMRHKSYATTQLYINMARQIDDAVNVLFVPDVKKEEPPGKAAGG
jgi:integrase